MLGLQCGGFEAVRMTSLVHDPFFERGRTGMDDRQRPGPHRAGFRIHPRDRVANRFPSRRHRDRHRVEIVMSNSRAGIVTSSIQDSSSGISPQGRA